MESSGTWDGTHVPCIGRQIPIHCATWEVPGYHSMTLEEEGNGFGTKDGVQKTSGLVELALADWHWPMYSFPRLATNWVT